MKRDPAHAERSLLLLSKMIERREGLKLLFRERYADAMKQVIEIVEHVAREKYKGDEVQASLHLAKEAADKGEDSAAQFFACAPIEIACRERLR